LAGGEGGWEAEGRGVSGGGRTTRGGAWALLQREMELRRRRGVDGRECVWGREG